VPSSIQTDNKNGTLADKERIISDLKEDIAIHQTDIKNACQVSHESLGERIFVCEKGTH